MPMRKWLLFVLLWAGLIFATSCTVISTDQLFRLVGFVFGEALLRWFETFWGIAWFVVVKSWHATEFGVLTAGLVLALGAWRPPPRARNVLIAACLAILFAASDEFHQTYVPTRGGTVHDVLIDSLGVGVVTLLFLVRLRQPRGLVPPVAETPDGAVAPAVVG